MVTPIFCCRVVQVCYYAVVTPINIAFDKSPFNVMALEMVFNTFFIIDIVLQFFTNGPNAGRLETSHSKIIWNYLKGWFLVDVLASFPIDLVMMGAGMKQESGGLNRLLRLVRTVKLMRILRMSRIWKRLLTRARLNPSVCIPFKCLYIEYPFICVCTDGAIGQIIWIFTHRMALDRMYVLDHCSRRGL